MKACDITEVFTTESGYCGRDILDKNSLKSIWRREPEFAYEGFIKGEFVVNCRTKKDSDIFLAYLVGKGYKFYRKDSSKTLFGTNDGWWNDYEGNTCYRIDGSCIVHAYIEFYLDLGMKVATFTVDMLQ